MSNVLAIARKELAGYFNSPIAYIVIVLYLVVTSVFFFFLQGFFVVGTAWLRPGRQCPVGDRFGRLSSFTVRRCLRSRTMCRFRWQLLRWMRRRTCAW